MAVAEGILRRWWAPWAWLVLALIQLWLLLAADDRPTVVDVFNVNALVGCLGLAVWSELNRRGAARLLDANRRHWGDG